MEAEDEKKKREEGEKDTKKRRVKTEGTLRLACR